ncbi:MAG: hypothetical protein WC283_03120 [Candidatus Paceibacterota bacterium]|jgi:protein-L-isoaspartate O-methyltransferase
MFSKEILIQEIIDIGYLKSPQIIEAFLAIDRKDFVTLKENNIFEKEFFKGFSFIPLVSGIED